MARVSYVDEEDLPEEYRGLTEAFRSPEDIDEEYRHLMSGSARNVYRVFAHLPPVLRAFRDLGGALWNEAGFTARQRELVILAVARELDSAYVWHQHVRIALNAGLPREDLLAVEAGDLEGFGDDERALMGYARAYVRGAVDGATHEAARAHFDEATVVGIGLLAAFYATICRSMDALDVDLEEPFAGWRLEDV